MSSLPAFLAAAFLATSLAGCSLPRVPGLSNYYKVTDPATSQVWYADQVKREDRKVVEFRDGSTGAWVSLPKAEVTEVSKAEYEANIGG